MTQPASHTECPICKLVAVDGFAKPEDWRRLPEDLRNLIATATGTKEVAEVLVSHLRKRAMDWLANNPAAPEE